MKPLIIAALALGGAAAALKRFGPPLRQSAHEKCMAMYQQFSAGPLPCEPKSQSPCPCESAESSPPQPEAELSPCGCA